MENETLLALFNSLKTEKDIESLINTYEREGLYIEYKRKDTKEKFSDIDKKNFSKPLSSFANSDGGILIWGVDDKNTKNTRERLFPIDDIITFERQLRSYLVLAVVPMVEKIQIDVVFVDSKKTKGYLKCLIPASDLTPHQAIDGAYYMRTVEGAHKMPHFQIADMFGKRQKPVLSLVLEFPPNLKFDNSLADENGFFPEITARMFIENLGRTVGRDAMLLIVGADEKKMKINISVQPGIALTRIDEMYNNIPTFQIGMRRSILYPTVKSQIGEIRLILHKDHLSEDDVKFTWTIYADNMQQRSDTVSMKFSPI